MVGSGSSDLYSGVPTVSEDRVHIPDNDDELLAACEVDTFRAGGPGGQHQNVTESAVRLRHRSTGVVVTSRAQRSQYLNKRDALRRLRIRLRRLNDPGPPSRRPTVPSVESVEQRLREKHGRGALKRERQAPHVDDF